MKSDNVIPPLVVPAARIGGHPVLRITISFPIACFSGALITDIVYMLTEDITWADFSDWLLAVGAIMGVLAAIGGIVATFGHRATRAERPSWKLVVCSLLVLILAFFDNLVHSRDAWTGVVPQGLVLSAATVIVMLVTVWLGSATAYRAPAVGRYPGAGS